jgi:hypothetical protein
MQRCYCVLTVALVLGVMSTSHAAVLIDHNGSTDPTTEGWSFFTSGPAAATGPINDAGTNAWFTDDNNSSALGGYALNITPSQALDARTNGWVMRTTAREADPNANYSSTAIEFRDGVSAFQVRIGSDSVGDPVVWAGSSSYTLIGGAGAFHDFAVVFDPVSLTADVFADGLEIIPNWTGGSAGSLNRIFWGAGSSSATGEGRFAYVDFEILPEPSSLILVAGCVLGGLNRRWR